MKRLGALTLSTLIGSACADESPLAGGAADHEDATLIAMQTAFDADDCATVTSLATGFAASTDLRLHAVTNLYGRCAYQTGDTASAIELLGRVAYVDPADAWVPSALYYLGRARLDAGDAATAIADLARFRERFAHHIYFDDAIFYSGKAHVAAGDPTTAIAEYAQVIALATALESRRVEARYETAIALVARANGDPLSPDFEAAFGWFQEVRENFPTSLYADNAAYHMGRVRFDQGRYADAIPLLETALTDWPTSTWRPSMGYVLGRSQYELNLFGPAIQAFALTIADPTAVYYDNALYYTGRAFYRLAADDPDRFTNAIAFFTRVITERPDSTLADDAAYFRARAYFELGDLTAAEPAFASIPADYPTSAYLDNALYYLVVVRVGLADCPGAKAALDALAAIVPTSSYLARTQAVFDTSACGGTP